MTSEPTSTGAEGAQDGGPRRTRGLTPDEVATVLRRASEIDAAAASGAADGDLVDPLVVEEAATEAGLSRAAVRRALDELALEPQVVDGGRVLGPTLLVVERRVAGTVEDVTARVHRYLRAQLLVPQRVSPTRSRWVPRQGLGATLRRATDLGGRLQLDDVGGLDLVVAPGGHVDGVVAVRLEIDLTRVRRGQAVFVAGGAGAGLAGAGVVVLVAGLAPVAAVALPVGAGLAAGGHLAGRSYYRRHAERVHHAVAGHLDLLEHPAALPPSPSRLRAALTKASSRPG